LPKELRHFVKIMVLPSYTVFSFKNEKDHDHMKRSQENRRHDERSNYIISVFNFTRGVKPPNFPF